MGVCVGKWFLERTAPLHRLAMGRGTARRVVEGPLRHAAASLWRATSPSQVDGEDLESPTRAQISEQNLGSKLTR